MLLRAAALAAVVLVAASCGGKSAAPQPKSELPPGCEVVGIAQVVRGLLAAVTAGDERRIARLLSNPDDFQGLTVVDPDRTFATRSPAKAARWLAGRHRYRESERLLQLVVGKGADANHVAIRLTFTRIASDFPARGIRTHSAAGAGAVDCVTRTVSRLTVATGRA